MQCDIKQTGDFNPMTDTKSQSLLRYGRPMELGNCEPETQLDWIHQDPFISTVGQRWPEVNAFAARDGKDTLAN